MVFSVSLVLKQFLLTTLTATYKYCVPLFYISNDFMRIIKSHFSQTFVNMDALLPLQRSIQRFTDTILKMKKHLSDRYWENYDEQFVFPIQALLAPETSTSFVECTIGQVVLFVPSPIRTSL